MFQLHKQTLPTYSKTKENFPHTKFWQVVFDRPAFVVTDVTVLIAISYKMSFQFHSDCTDAQKASLAAALQTFPATSPADL